ncbi:hypothetical protein C0J52_13840 [Blattella germanica]|nr:hypothetical protein C0J52_13840 [Blattella germanica]
MWTLVSLLLVLASVTAGNYPTLDFSTLMRMLLVPVDTKIGSSIYRLRGTDSDFDFPLQFDVVGSAEAVIEIENLPCSRNHSFCEANVILARTLELGRVYDLKVRLRDTRGDTTTNAKPGTELDYVIARKNPKNTRHASLELRGSPSFGVRQSLASPDTVNGTFILNSELDFEKQSMYTLTVYAVNAYAEPENDTRNLAAFILAVAVQDVQDMPPVFTKVPPVTLLNSTFKEGDVILNVHAEDGDKGSPRQVRYGLVSENNPFTSYFHMDDKSGNLSLAQPLKSLRLITQPHQPILLTVIADEVKTGLYDPPAMSSTAQLALIMGELENSAPYFENENYVAHIEENSPQGTALLFGNSYITEIRDDDLGKNGVFSISLENNNGTFEISPTVGETRTSFVIRVRNNALLDYEKRTSLTFTIVAQEVGPKSHMSTSAPVTVYLVDVNDNPPVFRESVYKTKLQENVTAGTFVVRVEATDIDTDIRGNVSYTRIYGFNNDSLRIDSKNGTITVQSNKHGFDREYAAEYRFDVEAADMNGEGNRATVPLIIQVEDINDNVPHFEKPEYEFVLTKDLRTLTTNPAIVKAFDADAEPPNNVVKYEILDGNRGNMFHLHPKTGVLTISNPDYSDRLRQYSYDNRIMKFELNVRAYDEGIPTQSSVVLVNVYPPEPNARNMTFIMSGYPERKEAEEILSKVTGGRVKIKDIQPLPTRRIRSDDSGMSSSSSNKSIVSARVLYDDNPTVDLTDLQKTILLNQSAEKYQRAESALFWILMVLAILIIIIIILLLLCCICPGCPLYADPKKGKQVNPKQEESVHLVLKEQGPGMETKAVQAVRSGHRREAWSADQRQQRHASWRFNRRNIPTQEYDEYSAGLDDRRLGYDIHGPAAASLGNRGHEDRHSLRSLPAQHVRGREGPTVIYTRELQDLQRHADNRRDIYLEDIEGGDYPSVGHIIDHRQQVRGAIPHREVRINIEEDHDTDSMRRHEVERGSDLGRGAEYRRGDVNRELDGEDREYHFVLHRGNPQRNARADGEEEDSPDIGTTIPSRREQFYIRDGNAEILRLVTRGRTGDEQEFVHVEPQPQQRPMTLVPPRQQTVRIENGKEILMQRFMEDQRNSTGQETETNREHESQETALLNSLQQQDLLVRRLLEEETRLNNTLLLTEALVAQRQHEQFVANAGEQIETQSLPGQTSMATQTDVDSSTQTEPMHLMRPPRRRARSDNDDSYTEEEEKDSAKVDGDLIRLSSIGDPENGVWVRKQRSKRKRNSFHRGELRLKRPGGKVGLSLPGRRHKIKTPIMEETESALEAAERQASATQENFTSVNYSDNKSSLLRQRKNKAKVTTTSGDMEVTNVPNSRTNDFEEVDEETPTDSLEERSPSKRKYASDDNRGGSYNRPKTPKMVSKSMVDVRDYEDNNWPNRRRVEFQDSDTYGSSSDRREAPKYREYLSDKGKYRASSYAASSDTSVRPSEIDNSFEAKYNPKERTEETGWSSIRSSKSETGLNRLDSNSKFLHRSLSIEDDQKETSERRHSISETSRSEDVGAELHQKQTIASRAKSSNHVNALGKSGSVLKRGPRYMEWYKTKREERERRKKEEEESKKDKQKKKLKASRLSMTDSKSAKNRENEKRGSLSEDGATARREAEVQKELDKADEQVLKVTVFDDDMDSGIAMSSMLLGNKKKRSQLLEKKSVFTIAYDDMQTKQLRPDSSSPKY